MVVSLNNLIITETPNKDTLDSPELVWELPEIPKYDDDSSDYITTSLVTITGDNVDFTKRIQHEEVKREGSSELKGYPDDTYFSDGEVALDLSSENLSFRMGEEYEFIVSFLDWNDELIKYAESTYTFPAYYPKYYAPDGEEVETLTPSFEWSFDEYEEWVESYDLYVNGRLFEENISGTTFTPDEALNFGDEFTWYVIPSYSSDGSPFFTTPPETAAFSTFDHAPPELVISVPGSGDEIFNGESYTFTADIETFDDTDIESVEWTVNGESYSGDSIDFEPSGLPAGTLQVSCTVTDSLGSTDTEAAEVVILNPRVAIDDAADRTVFAHEEVDFEIDSGNSGDVDDYIWSVLSPDGSEESFSGGTLAFEFTQLGEYEITAAGLKEDSFGNEKEVSSGTINITVESSGPPQLAFQKPAAMGLLAAGQEVGFTADISSTSEDIQNEITETIWEVNGEEFIFDGIQESFSYTPEKDLISGDSSPLRVKVTALDEYGDSGSDQREFILIDPAVSIANIEAGDSWPLNEDLEADVSAAYAESFSWFVNGEEQSGAYDFTDIGSYTLKAEAEWNIIGSDGEPALYEDAVEFSINVTDSEPPVIEISGPTVPAGIPLLTGVEYEFIGNVASESDIERVWWTFGGETVESDDSLDDEEHTLSYEFESGAGTGSVQVVLSAENSSGVKGQTVWTIPLIDPIINVSWPSDTVFSEGSAVSANAAVSSGIVYWKLQGETVTGEMVDTDFSQSWNKIVSAAGQYTLKAGYKVEAADSSGGSSEFARLSDDEFTFTVFSDTPPTITEALPNRTVLRQEIGQPITFSFTAESDNGDVSNRWIVSQKGSSIDEGTGNAFSYTWNEKGVYTVTATAEDPMVKTISKTWSVSIIDPNVVITYPEAGKTYGKESFEKPAAVLTDSAKAEFYLDGSEDPVGDTFNWSGLEIGSHTLQAEAEYYPVVDDTGTAVSTVRSPAVSFTVEALSPPALSVTGAAEGDLLLAGTEYTLTASADGSGEADIELIIWFLDGREIGSGTDVDITLNERGIHTITAEAVDEYGLSSKVSYQVTAVDPSLEIILPERHGISGTYSADTPITLQYSGEDIENISWLINGTSYANNTFTFGAGTYTVDAESSLFVRLESGEYGEYTINAEDEETIEIFSPVVPSELRLDLDKIYEGSEIQAEAVIEGDSDALAEIAWLLDNTLTEVRENPEDLSDSLTLSDLSAGKHTLQLRVTDIFGSAETAQKDFTVYKPFELVIESPADGSVFGPEEPIRLTGALSQERGSALVEQYSWSLNGAEIEASNYRNGLLEAQEPGSYTIRFSAEDILGNTITQTADFSVQSDLILSLKTPDKDMSLIEGGSVICRVSAETLSDTVPLDALVDDIEWLVDGAPTGSSGLSYTFTETEPGDYTIQARYEAEFDTGNVIRETREITISVEAVEDPEIVSPLPGGVVYYSSGDTVMFEAEGYPEADYTWRLDGAVIGRGRKILHDPAGKIGSGRLVLEMEYQGITRTQTSTISFALNTAPQLTLTAPSLQYTGQELSYTADAIDVEDGVLEPAIFFDGNPVNPAEGIPFSEADLGIHELRAVVEDSRGLRVEKQAVFTVAQGIEGLEIVSPVSSGSYIVNKPLTLTSSVLGGTVEDGSYIWKIQYLDAANGDSSELEITGNRNMFTPLFEGAVRASVEYDGGDAGTYEDEVIIDIQPEPVRLSLYWPHGSMVNAGSLLEPEAAGLSEEELESGSLEWYMDGLPVNRENLRAPAAGGEHTFGLRYRKDDKVVSRDKLSFTVNERPRVSILSPVDSSLHQAGLPVVVTASVEDDQPFSGSVEWLDASGNILAVGKTAALKELPAGTQLIRASVQDEYGLANTAAANEGVDSGSPDAVELTIYEALKLDSVTVNSGISTILLDSEAGTKSTISIPVNAVVSGGINPQVSWKLIQKSAETMGEGAAVELLADTTLYSTGSAVIRLTVEDPTIETITREIPLRFIDEAALSLLKPETGAELWTSSDILLQAAYSGFSDPEFSVFINDSSVASEDTSIAKEGMQGTAEILAECSTVCSTEGVYDLRLEASENGLTRTVNYTMNVFHRDAGVYITGAPETADMLNPEEPVVLEAETAGIEAEKLVWFTSQTDGAAGEGAVFNLKSAELESGSITVYVQALDSSDELLSEARVHIVILGDVQLSLEPADEIISVKQGAETKLTALGYDRDGTQLTGEAISWSSHSAGFLGTGQEFVPGTSGMEPGEHMLTVSAVGTGDRTKQAAVKVIIRASEEGPPSEDIEEDGDEEEDAEDGGGTVVRAFSAGRGISFSSEPEVVSTVISVSGNVKVIRDNRPQDVDLDTELTASDEIELRNNRSELMLVNIPTETIITLVRGSYIWDSDEETWTEE